VIILFFFVTYKCVKKARVFVRGKLFQNILMFEGKVGAPFPLDRLLTLPENIRQSWKGLARTNALAYLALSGVLK
jgi:hypothetical protein